MQLADLLPAIARIRAHPGAVSLRSSTYLRTYRHIVRTVSANGGKGPVGVDQFLITSCLAYSWMPRVARVDHAHLSKARKAFGKAQSASVRTWSDSNLQPIADCLHSIVGASKVGHFANPRVIPMWDKKVEHFRIGREPSSYHMGRLSNYIAYASDVRAILGDPGFRRFKTRMQAAVATRLSHLGIPSYSMSDYRLVDLAVFELAP